MVFINDFKYIGSKYYKNRTRSKRVESDVDIKSSLFHSLVRASFQPGQKDFLKVLFFCTFCLGGANLSYVRLALLYHEFEQFG